MDLVDLLEVRRQGLVLNTEAKVAPYGDTVLAAHGDDRGSVVRGDLPVSHERGGRERRSQRQDYDETIGRTLIDPEPPQNATQKKEDRSLSTVPSEGLGRPRERPRRDGATVVGGEILQGQVALTDMVGRGPVLVFLPSRFSVRVCRPRGHRDGDLDVLRVRKMSFRGKNPKVSPREAWSVKGRRDRGGGESGSGTRPDVGSLQFERGVHLERCRDNDERPLL